jgi:integrase
VRAALAEAYEDGLILSNPVVGVRIGRDLSRPTDEAPEQPQAKALSEAELRRLLVAVSPEWLPLAELLATTGLRISEASELRWGDVDFGRRRIKVQRRRRGADIDAPKSQYARRDVPVTPVVARRLWSSRPPKAGDDTLVFTRDGKPIERTAAFRAVRSAAKRAGIGEWVGLHTLRHSYASVLFSRGCSAVQVQRLLGHHSPAFTLSTYVHLLPDDLPDPTYLDEILTGEGVNEGSPGPTETGLDSIVEPAAEVAAGAAIS